MEKSSKGPVGVEQPGGGLCQNDNLTQKYVLKIDIDNCFMNIVNCIINNLIVLLMSKFNLIVIL